MPIADAPSACTRDWGVPGAREEEWGAYGGIGFNWRRIGLEIPRAVALRSSSLHAIGSSALNVYFALNVAVVIASFDPVVQMLVTLGQKEADRGQITSNQVWFHCLGIKSRFLWHIESYGKKPTASRLRNALQKMKRKTVGQGFVQPSPPAVTHTSSHEPRTWELADLVQV